jgi:hypothetical protein
MAIEGLQIQRKGVSPQSLLAFHIVKLLEIGEDQFPQGAVDGFPESQPYEVRFAHGAPMAFFFEERQQVVVVPAVGQHLQNQGRISQTAEEGGGQQGSVIAVGHPLAKHPQGAAVSPFGGVREFVQKGLDSVRGLQPF